MAFWGVEVKPGKPFHHPPSDASGKRLHVSQATLGIGTATTRSVVQCNVGESTPVLLCSLRPDTVESSRLNLEFEESDEVVFSVLGPLSVHLTGYYVQSLGNEMEPYGEDIANTDNELSVDSGNEDDEYEDSFIDDGDPAINPSSPDSGDEAADVKCGRKKYHLIESSFEEQGIAKALKPLDNNSEDNLPISLLLPKHKHEEKGTRIESETNTRKTYKHEEEEKVNKSETGKMKQREVGEVKETVNKDETTKLEQPIDLVSTFDVKSGRRRLKKKYELIDSSFEEQGIAKALKPIDNKSEDDQPTSLLLSKHKREEKETRIANEVNIHKSYTKVISRRRKRKSIKVKRAKRNRGRLAWKRQ